MRVSQNRSELGFWINFSMGKRNPGAIERSKVWVDEIESQGTIEIDGHAHAISWGYSC